MAVTSAELLGRLGATAENESEATRNLELAMAIVGKLITDAEAAAEADDLTIGVPDAVRDEGVLRCAVNLFNRAQAPNGFLMQVANDGSGGSTQLRVARDPLTDVRPLLAPYGVSDVWGFV